MKIIKIAALLASGLSATVSFAAKDGCKTPDGKEIRGAVKMDGSSTVFPVAEAIAEEFQKVCPRVRVTVGLSGTGGGFKKFTSGEIDISNASRSIKPKEKAATEKNKIKYMKLPVAFDGISVIVSKKNTFLKEIAMEDLKRIWEPGSKIKYWNEVDPKLPKKEIKLYGPGADSGTFDFFTEEVMGVSRASRSDYVASEDDNVLVRGVKASDAALGYFGYAYYIENKSTLNSVKIKYKGKTTGPTFETIQDGSYPLARPLLVYLNVGSAKRPEVQAFVDFFLKNAGKLSKEVGYIPLPKETYEKALAEFEKTVKNMQTH